MLTCACHRVHTLSSLCLLLQLCCQLSDEDAEMKELNKDLDAITTLMKSCRAASLTLSKLPHTAEMQQALGDKMDVVKAHQEHLEGMVFGKNGKKCPGQTVLLDMLGLN